MHYKIINGSVSRGSETILEQVNFEIRDREKIAIVGRNGCGKSTLLRAIIGELDIEQGTGEEPFSISTSGQPIIGYMQQTEFEDNSITMLEEIKKVFSSLIEMENRIQELQVALESGGHSDVIEEYTDLQEEFRRLDGYTYKRDYEVMIKKFGFTEEDKEKPLSDFSGGQRTKIAFIKLLLSKPDILLLDEPTNHLDLSTIRWLEDYLQHYRSSIVIVSHDRMFLDKIVDTVYEIEYGETHKYNGNYAQFERLKKEAYEKQCNDYEAQQAEIARLTRLIERFRYKATKAAMAQSKLKQLERMVKIKAPSRYDLRTFHADFQPEDENVKNVLSVSNLSIGYEASLATLNFEVARGQKLGIIGRNGIGKSTLLKTLVRQIEPLNGTFSFGVRSKIGYFDQQQALQGGTESVLDSFCAEFPRMLVPEARSALGAFQFYGDDVFKHLDDLSGGERVRLALCKILRHRPNVLILDEPTNHMDIVGKETLENMLSAYTGTILFVSHDRYFVKKIANSLLVFDENEVSYCPFGYTEYEEKAREKENITETVKEVTKVTTTGKKKFTTPLKELTRMKKRVEKLEMEIQKAEETISSLSLEMQKPEVISDYVRLGELQEELIEWEQKNEEMTLEWADLEDKIKAAES